MKLGTRYLVLEHRRPERETALMREVAQLRAEIETQRRAYHMLEDRFGVEVYLNAELVDLLKANGIRYRAQLDHREREKRLGGK